MNNLLSDPWCEESVVTRCFGLQTPLLDRMLPSWNSSVHRGIQTLLFKQTAVEIHRGLVILVISMRVNKLIGCNVTLLHFKNVSLTWANLMDVTSGPKQTSHRSDRTTMPKFKIAVFHINFFFFVLSVFLWAMTWTELLPHESQTDGQSRQAARQSDTQAATHTRTHTHSRL